MMMDQNINKKMIYFHPALNNPPLWGSGIHSHEMLKTLKEMGYKLYLFVLESDKSKIMTRDNWGYEEVFIFKVTTDREDVKEALSKYIDRVAPSYIFMNYASWNDVLDHAKYKSIKRIIYNHHFESIRKKMGSAYIDAWNAVQPSSIEEVHPSLYDLNFLKSQSFLPDPKEYKAYDQYNLTFAIADYGASLIREKCQKTKVESFPVTLSQREAKPTYQKIALYTMSGYNFMFQAYYFFVKCVLPLILKKNPLFRVRLVGKGSEYLFPASNIICKRFVADLKSEYEKASLCLCPSFSGTGQQVKVIEAMHYGVPSVCMHNPMQYNPIRHGQTGFIAHSAEEFAKYALMLFGDRDLAKQMGKQAQKEARELYSNKRLKESFKVIETL